MAGPLDLRLRRTDIDRLGAYNGGFTAVDAEESATCSVRDHPNVRDGKRVVYIKYIREGGGCLISKQQTGRKI